MGDKRSGTAKAAKVRVLIVEDDASLLFGLRKNLEFEGYDVLVASDGAQGLELAVDSKPDLVILDVMLPEMNGFEVCEVLRKNKIDVPVIFLTAKAAESDKLTGLDLGGDDYMTKPFSIRELLARIKTILRRVGDDQDAVLEYGALQLDMGGQTAMLSGKEVTLTSKEFQLLAFLAKNGGKVLERETILQKVWGFDYYGTARTIDNFINRLRQKLESDPLKPQFICTVRGVGYKFVVPGK